MALLQYVCPKCGKRFEEIVKNCNEEVKCPVCSAPARREWSGEMYSSTGKKSVHCTGNCKTCPGCGK